jgi:hypothetical protein
MEVQNEEDVARKWLAIDGVLKRMWEVRSTTWYLYVVTKCM